MIKVKVIAQTGSVFDGEVAYVSFPGEVGRFSVYPLHAPLVSTLVKGDIACFAPNDEKTVIAIQSGFVEIKNDQAVASVEL